MTQYTLGLTRLLGHGRAFSEVLPVANPAVAHGFTYKNDGLYWRIIDLISFQLVTDANAASRQVTLTIKDGGGVALATLPAASTQATGLTYQYTWSVDWNSFNTVIASAVTSPLPYIFLQPDYTVVVTIGSVQAGDQVSNIRIYAEKFETGAAGYLLGPIEVDDDELNAAIAVGTIR